MHKWQETNKKTETRVKVSSSPADNSYADIYEYAKSANLYFFTSTELTGVCYKHFFLVMVMYIRITKMRDDLPMLNKYLPTNYVSFFIYSFTYLIERL